MNKEKELESRLQTVLHNKGITLEDLQYIKALEFATWSGAGKSLLQYTQGKLKEMSLCFGTYSYSYFIDNKLAIKQNGNFKRFTWEEFRCTIAKDVLTALLSRMGTDTDARWHDKQITTAVQYADELIEKLKHT